MEPVDDLLLGALLVSPKLDFSKCLMSMLGCVHENTLIIMFVVKSRTCYNWYSQQRKPTDRNMWTVLLWTCHWYPDKTKNSRWLIHGQEKWVPKSVHSSHTEQTHQRQKESAWVSLHDAEGAWDIPCPIRLSAAHPKHGGWIETHGEHGIEDTGDHCLRQWCIIQKRDGAKLWFGFTLNCPREKQWLM